MFFSLSVSWGGLIMFGSYNKFKTRVHIHSTLISSLDFVTSIIAGVVVFSILGHLSCKVRYYRCYDTICVNTLLKDFQSQREIRQIYFCYSLVFQLRVQFNRNKALPLSYTLKQFLSCIQHNCGLCFSSSCCFFQDQILNLLFQKLF